MHVQKPLLLTGNNPSFLVFLVCDLSSMAFRCHSWSSLVWKEPNHLQSKSGLHRTVWLPCYSWSWREWKINNNYINNSCSDKLREFYFQITPLNTFTLVNWIRGRGRREMLSDAAGLFCIANSPLYFSTTLKQW